MVSNKETVNQQVDKKKVAMLETFCYLSNPMKVTPATIALIKKRFRDPTKPKINQSQLADFMGLGKAWVSKLMNRKLQNLSDDQVEKIESFLGIRLAQFVDKSVQVSPMAVELTRKMSEHPSFPKIVEALLEIQVSTDPGPLWVETKRLPKIGAEVTRIVMKWEEGTDPHYSKIAVEVLDFLRTFYAKGSK
jgi:transcriptional regulator with XRE-family HTH domain